MAALNGASTTAGYTPAATLITPVTQRLTVTVSNAAIYYQLRLTFPGVQPSDNDFKEERQLVPGLWTFDSADFKSGGGGPGQPDPVCTGIRFRSAVAANPAVINASD